MLDVSQKSAAAPAPFEQTVPVAETGKPRLHLGFLDGIRGLAALQVVFFHFIGLRLAEQSRTVRVFFSWTQFGHFAVDLFIVLSGFCLMLPYARLGAGTERAAFVKYAAFFKRRAWRILPAYYAALLLSIVAVMLNDFLRGNSYRVDGRDVLTHLLLIHNLFPQWHSSLNVALWSVATEWQIYFFFPLALLPAWKRWGNAASILVGFGIGLGLRCLVRDGSLDGACPWYTGLFAMGMIGAVHAFSIRPVWWTCKRSLLIGAVVAAALYVSAKFVQPDATTSGFNIQWIKDVLGGCVAWCLIVYCAREVGSPTPAMVSSPLALLPATDAFSAATPSTFMKGREREITSQRTKFKPTLNITHLLNLPVLTRLGAFSYSLYLVHGIVLEVSEGAATRWHLGPRLHLLWLGGIGIPCAMGFAWLFYRLIEQPSLARRATL